MKNVYVFLITDFEELEAITIIDILRRAGINLITVSLTDSKIVSSVNKVNIEADMLFNEIKLDNIDMLILPGGMPGSENLSNHKGLNDILKQFNDENKYLAAICAAPLVFGKLGLLQNIDATCYPGFEKYLIGANIKEGNVVVSNNIITSRGPGTAIEFSLKLVEILVGSDISEKLIKGMLIN